jgi:flagellar protein FliO/FliZ
VTSVNYLQFVVALVFVVGLIFAIGWLGRRAGLGLPALARGRQRRLQVVEMIAIDPRRRLVLVRRDDREHLLLIGGATDLAVETGIATPKFVVEEAAP